MKKLLIGAVLLFGLAGARTATAQTCDVSFDCPAGQICIRNMCVGFPELASGIECDPTLSSCEGGEEHLDTTGVSDPAAPQSCE